jgi:hypothetical protein
MRRRKRTGTGKTARPEGTLNVHAGVNSVRGWSSLHDDCPVRENQTLTDDK